MDECLLHTTGFTENPAPAIFSFIFSFNGFASLNVNPDKKDINKI